MAFSLGVASFAQEEAANPRAAHIITPSNPYARFWDDPDFVKSFMGAYGMATEVEPSLTKEEQAFYVELRPLLQDNPAKAASNLETRMKPDSSAQLNFLLASLYYQLDQPAKAQAEYENAVAKFPNFRRAHKNLGFALAQSGDFEPAITHLTRAIELGGAEGSVYGLLGYAYLNQEQYLSAKAAYENAVLHAPGNLDWKMGLLKAEIATGNHQAAGEMLEALLDRHPDQANLWLLQGGLHLQMDEPLKAAVSYEMVRRLGKADAKTMRLLGDLYMARELRGLALPAYQEAIRLDGEASASTGIRAAEILVSRGAWQEALALVEEVRLVAGASLADEDDLKILKLEARVALAQDEAIRGGGNPGTGTGAKSAGWPGLNPPGRFPSGEWRT